jgi:glutamine synthetase
MAASNDHLSAVVYGQYLDIELPKGKVMAEYVWVGGGDTTSGLDLRCKTKTLSKAPTSIADLPIWNYDGSSTGQAPGKDSEVFLKPVAYYPDPFRRGDHILVLAEACLPDGKLTPIPTNTRRAAEEIFSQKPSEVPWFGIEQEYTLFHADGHTPFGWPKGGFPRAQGPFYCAAGTENSYGRRVVEAHYRACLYAGLNISGVNGEVMPGQWEYQIGPCVGIESGDHMIMSRYLLLRVCEDFGVIVTLDPKPIPGDWNGAGAHCNFSTEAMRQAPGGYDAIIKAVEKLGKKHLEHIACYGSGNERRMTGAHETAPIDKFSYGVAHRGASVRIGRAVPIEKCGYFEDRRPASNVDPYVVSSKIFKTCILDD